ncbi:hypothetical protein [Alkaliphilus metalliredigens]|nr:hypothetical protein [Alkaliphilus metalliredigens]
MKKIMIAGMITGLIFFLSIAFYPIVDNFALNNDYTQIILLSLIFTLIFCTLTIIEEIKKIGIKLDDDKKNVS